MKKLKQLIDDESVSFEALVDGLPTRLDALQRGVLTMFLKSSLTRIAEVAMKEAVEDHILQYKEMGKKIAKDLIEKQ